MSIVRVREIEMGYTEAGRGTPVVLLHGFPFNRSMWSEQLEALKGSHRVIAPDLRGHGETTVTDDAATMEEMARDVAALLDELKIEHAAIGGLSMGGYVALAFCRLFPHRVRALILADTRAGADTEDLRRGREESAQRALSEGMEAIADQMLPKLLAPATLIDKPLIVERVRRMMTDTNPAGAAAALRGMAVRRDQKSFLPEISSPTLIVVGDEDAPTPPSEAEVLQRGIHGSRLVTINGAGHVSNIEQPAEFNSALTDFLGSLEP
ncbi:MAG: alpha/beta fold hydrolase [Acidobacteriota bacterium]|nr:alpha/beta fold hydrolase [Acidobacteriota bacterium]